MRRLVISLSIYLALLLAGCAPRLADLPPLIPREVLFENPTKKDPQISPDGMYLSYLAPDKKNVLQVWVRALTGQGEKQLTSEEKRGIQHYAWAYDNRHLIFARETDGDENWQIHAVNIESGSVRNLTPYKGVRSLLFHLAPDHPEELWIAMNLRNRRFFDVYRVHLKTGETRMVHRNGGQQVWWLANSQMNINIATTFAGVIVRDSQKQPWRMLRRWQRAEPGMFVGLSRDEKSLYLRASPDGNTGALLSIDIASGNETVIVQDPKYDVQDVFVHPTTHEIQAVGFYKEKLEWRVLDKSGSRGFPKNPCKEFKLYIAAQTDDDFPYVLKYAGEDNIVIGTDYGHTDASSEVDAIEVFRKNDTISEAVKKKILDDNPRMAYGL
jgi:hypothetical protein